MANFGNKIDSTGLVFLVSIIILFSLIFVKSNTDIAFSQTTSLATTFEVNESTYTANSSLRGNQIIENETTSKDYDITNTSTVLNPLLNNPTYSVTNATVTLKTDILEGLDSNKPTLVNQTQTIIAPQENVIIGQN
ncbi:hypothetical protein [Candidatus Nitrosocosmicus arcticus]|uniref:Uncharacterized protein n=1 Tax=Candidatus Nitrosocosmicus arcticus TaxID=2035267 RepID=A0A557SSA6_9ARCH|nr:hypothetical protein [Candidatus Nitrosocosmicus arcticus]TVP39468.1 hypothetical protein NARC_150062 [Candidatus Nitrosocosmicus arcticus]